jgi:6-phosphogluconolactonase
MTAARQRVRWHLYPSVADLLRHARRAVLGAAAEARARGGRFDLVLAGGTTPRALYEALAADGAGDSAWHVWFGDERCLPSGHPERNETMARRAWLDAAGIPPDQIHAIPAGPDPAAAARACAASLDAVDRFDLVLLGIGEDGHTASLFPGGDPGAGADAPAALAVRDAPKPPPDRVSLSAARLSRAHQVIVLATGAGKREALARWRAGEDLPVAHLRPPAGVDVFADPAAMPAAGGRGNIVSQ